MVYFLGFQEYNWLIYLGVPKVQLISIHGYQEYNWFISRGSLSTISLYLGVPRVQLVYIYLGVPRVKLVCSLETLKRISFPNY